MIFFFFHCMQQLIFCLNPAKRLSLLKKDPKSSVLLKDVVNIHFFTMIEVEESTKFITFSFIYLIFTMTSGLYWWHFLTMIWIFYSTDISTFTINTVSIKLRFVLIFLPWFFIIFYFYHEMSIMWLICFTMIQIIMVKIKYKT